jgi:hypothetical protein
MRVRDINDGHGDNPVYPRNVFVRVFVFYDGLRVNPYNPVNIVAVIGQNNVVLNLARETQLFSFREINIFV